MTPFVETLALALLLGGTLWFICNTYWGVPLWDSARLYLWGFMSDPFGICAASGFKEAWGLECISWESGRDEPK